MAVMIGKLSVQRVLLFAWLVIGATVADACNIPVFRYALERWRPDACEVIVFEDAATTAAQHKLLQQWERSTADNSGHANAKFVRLQVGSKLAAEHQSLLDSLKQQAKLEYPYVLARTKIRGQPVNHWHGGIEAAKSANLLTSPVRKKLSQRLLAGDSVIWLMIKSADEKRNQEARKLLQSTFQTLPSRVSLPEGVGLPGSELYSEIPLLLKFSLLEIDSGDRDESFLVELLSGFHPQALAEGDPLLVPVFGRGRALEVIPASELDSRLIEDLTLFLCGACSCQVKDQNPGFDLLISADWDTELFGEEGAQPPPAKSGGNRVQSPELLTIPPGR